VSKDKDNTVHLGELTQCRNLRAIISSVRDATLSKILQGISLRDLRVVVAVNFDRAFRRSI
jgi:hypothetical protein